MPTSSTEFQGTLIIRIKLSTPLNAIGVLLSNPEATAVAYGVPIATEKKTTILT
jgi:hypothetical protein